MGRRNRRGTIVMALAALGIILASSREAAAELTLSRGIVIVSGGGQAPDPLYTYQFQATLNGTIDANFYNINSPVLTTFTIDNLAGISSTNSSNSFANPGGWVTMTTPGATIGTTPTTDVTWYYFGSQIGPATNDTMQFSVSFDNPTTVTPTFNAPSTISLDGSPSTPGLSLTFSPQGIGALAFVPEPSTAIAPLIVLLCLPIVMLVVKRRARRGSLQAA